MAEKGGFNFDSRLLENIENDQVDEVKSMLNEDLIKASDESKNTLLHYAVLANSAEIVSHLIELGADLERPGKDGNTPIMLAIQRVNQSTDDIANAIANRDFLNDADNFPAIQTARNLSKNILELLLIKLQSQTAGTENLVNKLVAGGCNLVHCVVHLKDIEVIRCMLQRGSDVNSIDYGGTTVLHIAASNNDVLLVKLLIEYGANVNQLNEIGLCPLSSAAYNGNREAMKRLLEAGADPNGTGFRFDLTAIFIIFDNPRNVAVELTDECLELLFKHGAFPQNPNQLINIASRKNETKKINMFINHLVMLRELGRPIADFRWEQEQLRLTIPILMNSCQEFLLHEVFGNLTILKLLTDSESNMRIHVRNDGFILKLHLLLADDRNNRIYPYYCSILGTRISKAVTEARLEDTAIPILCQLLNINYNQCYNLARKIFGYLGEEDLKQVCRIELDNSK